MKIKKENCNGCYNDVYNHGCGGAKECWMFKDAKLIKRKMVHINQMPPFNQPARLFPSCYRMPQYVFMSENKT